MTRGERKASSPLPAPKFFTQNLSPNQLSFPAFSHTKNPPSAMLDVHLQFLKHDVVLSSSSCFCSCNFLLLGRFSVHHCLSECRLFFKTLAKWIFSIKLFLNLPLCFHLSFTCLRTHHFLSWTIFAAMRQNIWTPRLRISLIRLPSWLCVSLALWSYMCPLTFLGFSALTAMVEIIIIMVSIS